MRRVQTISERDERGVTLAELVVVIALAMLVSGLVVVALSTSARITRSSLTRTQAQEDARELIDALTSELRDAQPAQVCIEQDAQTGCRRIIDYPGVVVDANSSPEARQGLLPPAVILEAEEDRLAFPIAPRTDLSTVETVSLPDVRVIRVIDNAGTKELWTFRIIQSATSLTDPGGSAPVLYASVPESSYLQEMVDGSIGNVQGRYIADLPNGAPTGLFSYFVNGQSAPVSNVFVANSPTITAVRVQTTLTFKTASSTIEQRIESVDSTVAIRAGNYVRQRNADKTATL